jgi:hypothetical protein
MSIRSAAYISIALLAEIYVCGNGHCSHHRLDRVTPYFATNLETYMWLRTSRNFVFFYEGKASRDIRSWSKMGSQFSA